MNLSCSCYCHCYTLSCRGERFLTQDEMDQSKNRYLCFTPYLSPAPGRILPLPSHSASLSFSFALYFPLSIVLLSLLVFILVVFTTIIFSLLHAQGVSTHSHRQNSFSSLTQPQPHIGRVEAYIVSSLGFSYALASARTQPYSLSLSLSHLLLTK